MSVYRTPGTAPVYESDAQAVCEHCGHSEDGHEVRGKRLCWRPVNGGDTLCRCIGFKSPPCSRAIEDISIKDTSHGPRLEWSTGANLSRETVATHGVRAALDEARAADRGEPVNTVGIPQCLRCGHDKPFEDGGAHVCQAADRGEVGELAEAVTLLRSLEWVQVGGPECGAWPDSHETNCKLGAFLARIKS